MASLSCGFSSGTDSVSSPPDYTPGTPSSLSHHGPPLMPRFSADSPFVLGFDEYCNLALSAHCCKEYTPSSPSLRAASPDYTPSSPVPRKWSPDYTPASPAPRHWSPYYTPASPSQRAASPDYTPSSSAPAPREWSPYYTPASPRPRAASPEYTPSSPAPREWSLDYMPSSLAQFVLQMVSDAESRTSPAPRRHPSPEYTPSTPPPSPLVSDAESRTSPAPRRHHPYQRSGNSGCSSRASRISGGRHQRALGY